MVSNDPFNQFIFRTTINYDFEQFNWTYLEFGFYKRNVKENQWINHDHSLMHDPVYPILNDHLVYYKNWVTDQFTFKAISSNWPFRVILNPESLFHYLFGFQITSMNHSVSGSHHTLFAKAEIKYQF